MHNIGIVYGSEAQAKPIVVNIDTVYVHDNIQLVDDDVKLYSYNEAQYTINEYLSLVMEQNEALNKTQEEIIDNYTLELIEGGIL